VNPPRPSVSIIIPVYNCEDTVGKCLESLIQLEGNDYEIIMMNDGSTDRTCGICDSFPGVQVVTLDNGGPSRARNKGVELARGEFVVFTDGDCIVERDWLGELRKGFDAPDVAGVGGDQISPDDETPTGRQVQDFLKLIGFAGDYVKNCAVATETDHNPTCNVMYRKSVLKEVGGFDEAIWPGEDVELDLKIKRAGYRLIFNPEAVVRHYRTKTYAAYARMMMRYGNAQSYLVKRYGFFRKIHYVPLALIALVVCAIGLIALNPMISALAIPLLLVPPFFFYAKTGSLKKSLLCYYLLFITLTYWNWGFAVGYLRDFRSVEKADSCDSL
jgi:cellulose synthase/poly-beta-1,6-N-acetylglucosamine synthase-like glycosyltransferase